MTIPEYRDALAIRQALLTGSELALVDVRPEAEYARQHPLFAVNIPLGRLELDAWRRIPRHDTAITLYDDGEGLAERARQRLISLGYRNVALLRDGLAGWHASGGELFRDVNVPSKAFGELVEQQLDTPSLTPQQVRALQTSGEPLVIVDARRPDEYHTMSIPGATSVPGAELVRRIAALAPDPRTRIVVNCAGRTRSIIGTQSLINIGLPNPVTALRNGTIGWTLAGYELEHGQNRSYPQVPPAPHLKARAWEQALRAGVQAINSATLARWQGDTTRTTYLFDVRSESEYLAGHFPDSLHVPGGQLVQETDHHASVRGARIVLTDDDGIRAPMTASWLAQMGWEVALLPLADSRAFSQSGPTPPEHPPLPQVEEIDANALQARLIRRQAIVLDFTASASYVARHIPGAFWLQREQLAQVLTQLPEAQSIVVTCGTSLLARFAAPEVAALTGRPVAVLRGGTAAWIEAGLPLEQGETRLLSPRNDRYQRPYEGTDNPSEAMNGYLEWEYGLVAQLARDGTHGFRTIAPLSIPGNGSIPPVEATDAHTLRRL
ncbi:rhodanese-related sulfurtransferase [Enterobacteriaceae bacterium BIT-l23]|nr:rhodanese-related sulfurtransferase [Enterobacteriaceae bacterium BIT-l23]